MMTTMMMIVVVVAACLLCLLVAPASAATGSTPFLNAVIDAVDVNDDGNINDSELKNINVRLEDVDTDADGVFSSNDILQIYDANSDGRISDEEIGLVVSKVNLHSIADVQDFFTFALQLPQYADVIEREQISGIDLFRYETLTLKRLNVENPGHAYRIRRSLAQLRVNGEASFPSVKLEACHISCNSLDFKATSLATATTLYRLRFAHDGSEWQEGSISSTNTDNDGWISFQHSFPCNGAGDILLSYDFKAQGWNDVGRSRWTKALKKGCTKIDCMCLCQVHATTSSE
eukprot:g4330.t1